MSSFLSTDTTGTATADTMLLSSMASIMKLTKLVAATKNEIHELERQLADGTGIGLANKCMAWYKDARTVDMCETLLSYFTVDAVKSFLRRRVGVDENKVEWSWIDRNRIDDDEYVTDADTVAKIMHTWNNVGQLQVNWIEKRGCDIHTSELKYALHHLKIQLNKSHSPVSSTPSLFGSCVEPEHFMFHVMDAKAYTDLVQTIKNIADDAKMRIAIAASDVVEAHVMARDKQQPQLDALREKLAQMQEQLQVAKQRVLTLVGEGSDTADLDDLFAGL